jgi:N-acetylmuramoyl-L-alanine amidase
VAAVAAVCWCWVGVGGTAGGSALPPGAAPALAAAAAPDVHFAAGPVAPPVPAPPTGSVWLLARLVQVEAGNQPFAGMVAVAAVVVNRTHAPGFPHALAAVIREPGQFALPGAGPAPGSLALRAARAALAGWDPTHGALYFYNPALTTSGWMRRLPVTARIGAQVFCR